MGRRLGRPKAGQELLTRERILDAALRLVDEQGMAALSMRRLAAELGVDPMALYHHLPGKAAHEPWKSDVGYERDYPLRIVDHADERQEALDRYQAARG